MKLSIRWKLILGIVGPLIFIASVVMWFTFDRITREAMSRIQVQVTDQARYYASRLDDRFIRVQQLARATANTLETLPLPDENGLYALLKSNLRQDPLVYGSAIAFEPGHYRDDLNLFSPYVFRQADSLVSMDIGAEGYDYTHAEKTWYSRVREEDRARWSGPYFDEGAGNILMNTYSVPFYREGLFSGVATVDVPLKQMSKLVDIGDPGGHPYVIMDSDGRFISHPNPNMIMKNSLTIGPDGRSEDPALAEIVGKLVNGQSGVLKVQDAEVFDTDDLYWVFHSPIKSTGWVFAMAIPENEILGYFNKQMNRGVIGLVIMIGLTIICVLIIGTSLTRPLTVLNEGVRELAQGDLNIEITSITSSDEIGELARGFNAMVAQLRRHVHELTRETAARESYETEMNFAHQVQASLLPAEYPAFPDYKQFDLYGINRPARHVAGDFFDYFMLENNHLVMVIADVSGKGMASALLMAITRTIVRNQARAGKSPAQILCEANRLLIETNMPSLYVTMFIASYCVDSGKITYANAGHPRPYKVCCDNRVTKFGDTTGTIVGMLDEAEFSEAGEQLNPGDYLVLYTDGVPDARSPDGEFLGEENFVDLLKTYFDKPVNELCESIVEILIGYQGSNLKDDTTLLVIKRN